MHLRSVHVHGACLGEIRRMLCLRFLSCCLLTLVLSCVSCSGRDLDSLYAWCKDGTYRKGSAHVSQLPCARQNACAHGGVLAPCHLDGENLGADSSLV